MKANLVIDGRQEALLSDQKQYTEGPFDFQPRNAALYRLPIEVGGGKETREVGGEMEGQPFSSLLGVMAVLPLFRGNFPQECSPGPRGPARWTRAAARTPQKSALLTPAVVRR
jgi:hypothetical protein